MKKIIVSLILIVIFCLSIFSLNKKTITIDGTLWYKECKISSLKEIINLYTNEELSRVYSFTVESTKELIDMEGLEKIPNLVELSLNGCGIKHIEHLDKLTKLQQLELYDNHITKIEGIDNLKSLVYLNLSRNQITKIENIDDLISLSTLILSYNKIQKIERLDKLISIDTLVLSNNKIEYIENLKNLKLLQRFSIENNPLKLIDEPSYNYFIAKQLFQVKYKVKVSNLVLREDKKTDSKIVRKLNNGELLQWFDKISFNKTKVEKINNVEGKWRLFVTDKGEVGWCFDAYLEEVK